MFPVQDSVRCRHVPIITWGLVAINAGIFFYELLLPQKYLTEFLYEFGMVPARYFHPEWAREVPLSSTDYWAFLTSLFLHGGLVHIVSNMWILSVFGNNVEDKMGSGRFLIFYLLCGIAAGLVHLITNAHSFVPAVGASGAIAGVMGAYLLLFPRARILTMVPLIFWPYYFELPAYFFMMAWFVSQFMNGLLSLAAPFQIAGIAWWAHIGGFLAGVALCALFLRPGNHKKGDPYEACGSSVEKMGVQA